MNKKTLLITGLLLIGGGIAFIIYRNNLKRKEIFEQNLNEMEPMIESE